MPPDAPTAESADSFDPIPLAGSKLPKPRDVRYLQKAKPDTELTVTLHVRGNTRAPSLDELATQTATDVELSLEEYQEQFGASEADTLKVSDFYVQKCGLELQQSDRAQCMIVLKGTVAQFNKAFTTELKRYDSPVGMFRAYEGELSVPKSLVGIVETVSGLDSLGTLSRVRADETFREHAIDEDDTADPLPSPAMSVQLERVSSSQATEPLASGSFSGAARLDDEPIPAGYHLYYPSELARMYEFPEEYDGSGETIGIISIDGHFRQRDLDDYFRDQNIRTQIPIVENIGGYRPHRRPYPPGPPNRNWHVQQIQDYVHDFELTMDLQVAGSVAPGAKLVVFRVAPNAQQPYLNALKQAFASPHRPSIISISYGQAEFCRGMTLSTMQAANKEFAKATRMRITTCAASGDAGSASRDYDSIKTRPPSPHVNFPASSPFVLAVGGTEIETSADRIVQEFAWNDLDQCRLATAGGISKVFERPSYQSSLTPPKAPRSIHGNFDGRGIPDVAANASPASGYRVLFRGRRNYSGGTSASAPLWAGLIARINQGLGRRVGFIHPYLYRLAGTPAFRDITQGNNGYYKSGKGWDACTGIGVPVGRALMDALKSMVPQQTDPDPRTPGTGPRPSTPTDLSAVVGAANHAAMMARYAAYFAQSTRPRNRFRYP